MSSSDSSADENNKNNGPPPPPPFAGKPKTKKKKKLPPQESINKIWSRFSASNFSKAFSILPNTPLDPSKVSPKTPRPNNLLVSEDYERAVAECRSKVQKLIRECKRVNMRYRDPAFDIDWDLKWEKGYCLNSLADYKFAISGRAFANPTANVPRAVKRVHEIYDKPTFLGEKVSPADVQQGSLGDCWLMSSLTGLANMENGIQRICVEYDTKIGIYGFVFHRDGEWIISIVDDKLYLKSPDWDSPSVQRHLLEQTDREDVEEEYRKTYQTGSQALFFAHCKQQNEIWLPLLEKAYAKAHGDYAALYGGWIGEGLEDLTGGVTTELLTSDILDTDEFWSHEIMKVNKEFLFGCSTGLLDGGYGTRDGISEGHAYVIMEARELSTGERLLKLRNPWGKGKKGNWEGAWSDGSKEFTPEAQIELKHKFGSDSVFWISYQDLLRKYQHFDRTRLFQDSPDWRITQKWISVEVSWRAEFEQKFRIVLKKESPVVLVLSQLDDRYFDGLQGQYSYRLQFRLHEVDSPGEEDYIVRSHGNYLMERSVVTELKSLKAGIYSVFIMVVADRDTSIRSVEDVVKAQCRRKTDNDKLAQVGLAYDLAHSKGAEYSASQAAARKAKEKAKAREARIATRKKQWEKRHLVREIVRKQDKKNREKQERKETKDEAADAEEKENEPKDVAVQTEDIKEVKFGIEDNSVQTDEHPETLNDNDRSCQTEDYSGSTSSSASTPRSSSAPSPPSNIRVAIPSAPPPPGHFIPQRKNSTSSQVRYSRQSSHAVRQYITSDGESSASPISDLDNMYSDDDPTLKPKIATEPKKKGGSDTEDEVEAWNAVCIVGFRVYSKDEGLEVKVFEQGMDELPVLAKGDEETGTGGDVEGEVKKKEMSPKTDRDKKGDAKKNGGDVAMPLRAKETDELVLVDGEKKAMGLAAEEITLSTDDGVAVVPATETKPEIAATIAAEKVEVPTAEVETT